MTFEPRLCEPAIVQEVHVRIRVSCMCIANSKWNLQLNGQVCGFNTARKAWHIVYVLQTMNIAQLPLYCKFIHIPCTGEVPRVCCRIVTSVAVMNSNTAADE